MATTAAQVIDLALQLLDEDILHPVFWTRPELLQYLNDGLLELGIMAGKFQSQRSFLPTANTFQDTPSGAIALLHVSRSSVFLRKKSLEAMDREKPNWQNEVSAANQIKVWGPAGINRFFVYPKLASTGSSIDLVTLDVPTTLAEGTTIPLDDEYAQALHLYVFHAARLKEGGAEFQQSIKAYETFRAECGHIMQRKMSEEYLLWSKEPYADSGSRYSTEPRS